MVQIIPAILATSEKQYKDDLQKLTACEGLKEGWVHIDFADNKFVQNKTVGIETTQQFPTNFRKEAHLMVAHPKKWIEKLVDADFERIIFHIESENDPIEVIESIKAKGLEIGLALNHKTDVGKVRPFIGKIDVIVIMTIVAGFQGQPFIPQALNKVRKIKSEGWSVKVGVDGHVNDMNAKEVAGSGVDFVIVGSYLLKGDIDENLERLWEELIR